VRDRLVVGFDGSAASVAALEWASEEATVRKASIRVLSSYAMPPVMDYYGIGTSRADEAELTKLERSCEAALRAAVAESSRRHPSVGFVYHVVAEHAGRRLVDESNRADLVIVGSNGLGATKSFLLGSVTGFVLHESSCPVVTVPAQLRRKCGTIIVGIDGSDHSTTALHWAADEADRHSARLVVVHAWEYPYRISTDRADGADALVAADAGIELDRAVSTLGRELAQPMTHRLVPGGAVEVLLDQAGSADLLVVGSRGRGGFRSMLLGSVAQGVAAHASCPVVVVR
jgi:nucleotide-binding universal stress UspA family protein